MDGGGGKSEMELLRNKLKTYTKRIKGLQKKIYEFSTLVGVDAAMIAYRPKKGNNRGQVDTYPENLRDVIPVVKRYLGIPKLERTKRHKQYSGPGDDNGNVLDIVRDNSNDNAADGLEWDDEYDELSVDQIQQLTDSVQLKMQELDDQIQFMDYKENENPSCVTSGISEHGAKAAAAATAAAPSGVQMQQAYVLQPLNQNLTGHQQMNLANGSAMVPTMVFSNNGVTTTNGSNVPYPMVMQYPMMAVQQGGGNQVQYQMMAVQPGGGNQAQFGNQQGPFTYFMQPVFVQQQPMTASYIPNLVPGGASSDA